MVQYNFTETAGVTCAGRYPPLFSPNVAHHTNNINNKRTTNSSQEDTLPRPPLSTYPLPLTYAVSLALEY